MKLEQVQGVFFDCWDTLISFCLLDKSWNYQTLQNHCLNRDEIDWDEVSSFCDKFYREYYSSYLKYELTVEQILNCMVLYFHMRLDCSLTQCSHEILIHLDPKPIAGIETFLSLLENHHIPYACLSNTVYTKEDTQALIENLIPNHHFSFVLASSEVGVKKPHPIFFQTGVRMANMDISKCIYIGDRLLQDACGSYRAGFGLSVWLNHEGKKPEELNYIEQFIPNYLDIPFLNVKSYQELIRYFTDSQK